MMQEQIRKIEKIKEFIKQIKELEEDIEAKKYTIEFFNKENENETYILSIKDNKGKEIFRKEIDDYEYEMFVTGLDDMAIWTDFVNVIVRDLKRLKKSKVIKDFDIDVDLDYGAKKYDYSYSDAYIHIYLYTTKNIVKELKKEFEDTDVIIRFDNNNVVYIFTYIEYAKKDNNYKVYVSKETAKSVIKTCS